MNRQRADRLATGLITAVAALGLGATRWQVIWGVTVPAARSGILTAVMLGVGRSIGETMAVMMVTGNAANLPPLGPGMFFAPVRTMTAPIAAEMGEVVVGSPHYSVLFFLGVELFAFTFVINLLARAWVKRVVRRLGGARA